MLLRFKVENHLSIAAPQELFLVASKLKGNETGLRDIPGTSGLKAVPAALIYGANASGKTNFLEAIRYMRSAIRYSHSRGKPQGGLPRVPFLLDEEIENTPSSFEAEFIVDNIRYIFGFTCDEQTFLTEWLYEFPGGRQRMLYEREGKDVKFGSNMEGAKKSLVEFMRENSLFISTATQNDHAKLSKIVNFFDEIEYSMTLEASELAITESVGKGQIDPRTIKFLESIGSGVVDMQQKEQEIPERNRVLHSKIFNALSEHFGDDDLKNVEFNAKKIEVRLVHKGRKNQYALPLYSESSGTLRLLLMVSAVFRALDKGSLVIIDEIDASLHTLVAEQVLELFTNPEYNPKGAQLIATTHDTNILGSKHLRRDQIWFSEKDEAGASSIFSLADFKLRETDRFEKGYLEGRFGAIPFAGDLRALLESKSE